MHHIPAVHRSILAMHHIPALHRSILAVYHIPALHRSIPAVHHIPAVHRSIPAVDHSSLALCCFIPAVRLSVLALEHHLSAAARAGGQELAAGVTARCSRPKDVANAHIDVGNNTPLNAWLRYTCNPGYKRKAGTSSLIQCILRDGSTEPEWTRTTLQCIRDPALPPLTPSPELPTALYTERMTQRVSIQTLASYIGLPLLVVAGIVACCCWRMKTRAGQHYAEVVTAIPMVAPAAGNTEMLPPSVFPTG
ncbi:PREDICTED: interleukin-15 receptor subunit alpha [Nipponia nippon]|uniref:interleukin-15 receptor subunit alpha n=1 Tax=Nipponia nippon TaxID=128390 RepID=UPI0005115EE1|nr:PREDICTED: interleukin-15 receptor subunit alpha [Nipponia nippon]